MGLAVSMNVSIPERVLEALKLPDACICHNGDKAFQSLKGF